MKRILLLAVVAILLVGAGFLVTSQKEKELAALPKPQMSLPTVQVAPITSGELEVTAHYLGSIEPFTKSDLSARISGNILSISKREGDTVRKGEVVIVIDDRELMDRSVAVNAEVLATQQRLAGAKSAYLTQKAIYDRDVVLLKAGAISKEALERSQAALDGARTTVDAYHESIKGLSMNSSVARTQAGYARVMAPFAGVVTKRLSDPGDLAVPGKPILSIEKTSQYKIMAQVPQEELKNVHKGAKVYLKNGEQALPASVNRVYPALGKNMLAMVEVLTPQSPFNLPSASTVSFDLVTNKLKGLTVPDNALVRNKQGGFLYLVKNGAVHIQPVKIMGMAAGKVIVEGDVSEGAIVALGHENKLLSLAEGGKVTTVAAAGGKP